MRRPGKDHEPSGERLKHRRRQFEDSRGLSGRRELPLEEDSAAEESAPGSAAAERDEESSEEGKRDAEGEAP
jgi:hypothetical protein